MAHSWRLVAPNCGIMREAESATSPTAQGGSRISMYLHLFSGGSMRLLDTIAARIGEQVAGVPQPIIGYLPGAVEDYRPYLERVTATFAPVGTVQVLDLETTAGATEFAAGVAACRA